MRVVVTGGPKYGKGSGEAQRCFDVLDKLEVTELAHGGGPGADALAAAWAAGANIPRRTYRLDRKKRARAAEMTRNREMLEAERPDLVVAFPGAASDCVARARAMGIEVFEVPR